MRKDETVRWRTWVAVVVGMLMGCGGHDSVTLGNDQETPEGQIRILPLGDSITQSAAGHDSYRRNLYHKLVAAGHAVDFVGSMNRVWNNEIPPHADYDRDHEGHWGWRADEILEGFFWQPNAGYLSRWLGDYTPDVALIHIGSNDMSQAQDVESTVGEITRIIETLRADNPGVVIFLAMLIPWNDEAVNARILSLNARMGEIAAATSTAQSPVVVVDQYRGFDAVADTWDGVHPNDTGEEKMAQRWFEALDGYLSSLPDAQDRRQGSGR